MAEGRERSGCRSGFMGRGRGFGKVWPSAMVAVRKHLGPRRDPTGEQTPLAATLILLPGPALVQTRAAFGLEQSAGLRSRIATILGRTEAFRGRTEAFRGRTETILGRIGAFLGRTEAFLARNGTIRGRKTRKTPRKCRKLVKDRPPPPGFYPAQTIFPFSVGSGQGRTKTSPPVQCGFCRFHINIRFPPKWRWTRQIN